MLLLFQLILYCLLFLALVKYAVKDSGRNCLYFYPDAYLDEAQKRGIADKTEELRKGKRFMTFSTRRSAAASLPIRTPRCARVSVL